MRARRTGGVSRQAGNAAVAALTAASTSAAPASGTARMTCPVAGFVTSPKRPLLDATGCPLIHSGTRVAVGLATAEVDINSSTPTLLYSRYEIADRRRPRRCRFRDRSDAGGRRRLPEILGREITGRGRKVRRRGPQVRRHV